MQILATIIPIFAIIFLGWLAQQRGFMPYEFYGPANRLVYFLAIPAMIFRSTANASFSVRLDVTVVVLSVAAVVIVFALSWSLGWLLGLRAGKLGTFVQNSFHGNLGYIGLAVAYYYLGAEGFARASIIAAFLMILQNILAVIVLQATGGHRFSRGKSWPFLSRIGANPIILSALAGMGFSISPLSLPVIFDRSLAILSGLALPMALLIIGGSLSFNIMKTRALVAACAGALKLVVLPGIGYAIFSLLHVPGPYRLPGIILLGAPTATVAFVMAKEMEGDADFAVAAISTTTLASAATFSMWLKIAG
jgi:hypothetical protein